MNPTGMGPQQTHCRTHNARLLSTGRSRVHSPRRCARGRFRAQGSGPTRAGQFTRRAVGDFPRHTMQDDENMIRERPGAVKRVSTGRQLDTGAPKPEYRSWKVQTERAVGRPCHGGQAAGRHGRLSRRRLVLGANSAAGQLAFRGRGGTGRHAGFGCWWGEPDKLKRPVRVRIPPSACAL